MPTYKSPIDYINDGENVDATVANRPLQQLLGNTDYLLNTLSNLTNLGALVRLAVPVRSNVVPGTPVYFNSSTARYEPALATIEPLINVIGFCLAKPYSGSAILADLVLDGFVSLAPVLETGQTLQAKRYYLSSTQAGSVTTVPPSLQMPVLVADALGIIYVMPQAPSIGLAKQSAAGNTTDGFVSLFTATSLNGILAVGTIFNTGLVNDLTIKETVTDLFGVTDNKSTNVTANTSYSLTPLAIINTAAPPYVSYQVSVKSTSTGNPTSFSLRFASTQN